MRSASGNGFDSSDSFAVSGAAERTARLHDIPPSITPSHGDDSHLLSRIASPADVKALAPNELAELCREIRTTLLAYGHQHGGHIGSNLGMVEATVALHRVFDSPRDRIVFDVSHQSYVHKMLTGRAAAYLDPDRFSEVTGFTNPDESKHDQFVLGHTGTSISLACGLAKTRDMEGPNSGIGNVIAVIGDGSLSSGVAFEGLNNAAEQGGNLIIVFNDNEMSIAGDFGGMYGPLVKPGGLVRPAPPPARVRWHRPAESVQRVWLGLSVCGGRQRCFRAGRSFRGSARYRSSGGGPYSYAEGRRI